MKTTLNLRSHGACAAAACGRGHTTKKKRNVHGSIAMAGRRSEADIAAIVDGSNGGPSKKAGKKDEVSVTKVT